jgi:hypothetical protein
MFKDTFFRFLPFRTRLPSKFAKTANMRKNNFHVAQIQYGYKKRRFDGHAAAQKSEKHPL